MFQSVFITILEIQTRIATVRVYFAFPRLLFLFDLSQKNFVCWPTYFLNLSNLIVDKKKKSILMENSWNILQVGIKKKMQDKNSKQQKPPNIPTAKFKIRQDIQVNLLE